MITQTLKRWLHKICVWQLWKRTPESNGDPVVTKTNVIATQDAGWCAALVDGQTGVISTVVEQEKDASLLDTTRPTTEASLECLVQPSPSAKAENPDTDVLSYPSPTFEQHLAFLQYLMRHGIINEGFGEGQVPKQYRQKL